MQLKTNNLERNNNTIDGPPKESVIHVIAPNSNSILQVGTNDFASNVDGVLAISNHHATLDNKPLTPPYRMPPQPTGGNAATLYGESSIPGAESSPANHLTSNIALRAHSSKFPVERELVLSNDKGPNKVALMKERSTVNSGLRTIIAPDQPPKLAWNAIIPPIAPQQIQQQQPESLQASQTGAIPRTPARLPEDVTALAERENYKDRDFKEPKNAVTKTYHTLKDLISSKFKKDSNEISDELNNVVVNQQNQTTNMIDQEDPRSPYSALPAHMRQMQTLNQSQPNIWNGGKTATLPQTSTSSTGIQPLNFSSNEPNRNGVQQRATSQPQLNMPFEKKGSQLLMDSSSERRGSLANIDVTDSDEGGFASRQRRPQTMYQVNLQQQQQNHQQQYSQRNSPHVFQNGQNLTSMTLTSTPNPYLNGGGYQAHQLQQQSFVSPYMHAIPTHSLQAHQQQISMANQSHLLQTRQDALRSSFQKQHELQLQQQQFQQIQQQQFQQNLGTNGHPETHSSHQTDIDGPPKLQPRSDLKMKQMPSSAASSDYDKSGNHSSNVDSGRGSAAYSSGRNGKGTVLDTSPESSDSHPRTKDNESEWVDIVDAELRNILEPGIQAMSLRPESTVSGSISSMTPPLPPMSPDVTSRTKAHTSKESSKLEYGMDSYNRPGRTTGPIGPSRAGWPGSTVQKQGPVRSSNKKQDQNMLKRHLFGLDNDQTSTTTRSLDLESLLGGPWGAGQSVSDSETDTQGLRHIRSQLEGLEHMYSEVLRMLGSRVPNNRVNETPLRNPRRRHGSLSSLPSSSVSSRPIRDRRRTDDRRKVRDIKGINKRFQRLESHVVTLARSVAHLSSEMRSQHLVTQELERLRDDLTTLRLQAVRSHNIFNATGTDPEPPNLTNPRRVKKLTKFFGEDPPLMRLFLKKLGYEKYATLFETERVGMIELPYLGEERLQKLGVPLGPRLRILQEAQISLCKDTTLCIV